MVFDKLESKLNIKNEASSSLYNSPKTNNRKNEFNFDDLPEKFKNNNSFEVIPTAGNELSFDLRN